jgi:hypothetical protein
MTYKFAKIKNGEVVRIIDTLTDIPVEMFEKKGILPVKDRLDEVPFGYIQTGFEYNVKDDKVIRKNIVEAIPINNIRSIKLNELEMLYYDSILNKYSFQEQLNVLFGAAGSVKTAKITDFINAQKDKFRDYKLQIKNALTLEELNVQFDFSYVEPKEVSE